MEMNYISMSDGCYWDNQAIYMSITIYKKVYTCISIGMKDATGLHS